MKTLQKRYGNNWTDFDNQLEFVNWELNNTHKKAGDALRQAKGLYNTGRIVSDLYEIPAKKWNQNDDRQKAVYDLHNKFSGLQLTAEDKANFLKGTTQRAIDNYNATQNVTSNVIDLSLPQQNTTFASVPDVEEPKEVVEAKQSLQQKQAEENFLNELNQQNFAFEEPQQQIQPKQIVPQISPLERYAQIESFVGGNPVAQQGGRIPVSSRGVYDYPNQEVIVPTTDGRVTMKNITYPILGIDEYGNTQLMQPDGEYQFQGKTIHEVPQLTQQEINFLKDIQNKNKFQ